MTDGGALVGVGEEANVRYAAARVHIAAWRYGRWVAARGACAAAGDAGDPRNELIAGARKTSLTPSLGRRATGASMTH